MGVSFKNRKMVYGLLYSLFIAANIAADVSLVVLEMYALLLGLFIIYKLNWESGPELLYYFVLLFSVMDYAFNLPLLGRFNIYYLHLALLILTVILFVGFLKRGQFRQPRLLWQNKYILFLSIFIIYMFASLLWVSNLGSALKYLLNYLIMICFLSAVYHFNYDRNKLRETFKLLFVSAGSVLLLGCFEMAGLRIPFRNIFTDSGWYSLGIDYLKTIPTVFFYNPNNYAVYLIMVMSFLIPGIVFVRNKLFKGLLMVMQIVCLSNLIFTTSRTAWMTMFLTILGFIFFFLFQRERSKAVLATKVGLVTLIIFYSLSYVPALDVYYGKFNDTPILNFLSLRAHRTNLPLFTLNESGSANERYTIIVDVIKGVTLEGHWQGFGVNNTSLYLAQLNNTHGFFNVHSLWFEILGDFGLFIFFFTIYIYLSLLWDLLKFYRSSIKQEEYGLEAYLSVSLIAALGGFILTSFAPSSVISFSQMWLLFALAASLVTRREKFIAAP
jgi:teichuronic acid biosynthesis protein TuaE